MRNYLKPMLLVVAAYGAITLASKGICELNKINERHEQAEQEQKIELEKYRLLMQQNYYDGDGCHSSAIVRDIPDQDYLDGKVKLGFIRLTDIDGDRKWDIFQRVRLGGGAKYPDINQLFFRNRYGPSQSIPNMLPRFPAGISDSLRPKKEIPLEVRVVDEGFFVQYRRYR